jgi:hypothetical protein
MSPRKPSRKLPPGKRRELQVAAAVAREAILELHLNRALRLIELADQRVSAVRILNIYLRLQGLVGASAEVLANRVLASLGQRGRKGLTPSLFVEGEDESEPNQRSFWHVVRDRLRGRVHDDLRRWVELHTGATHVALLDAHVRHALGFVRELAETHTIEDACATYCELAEVPVSLAAPVYMFVLDRLATEELPRKPKRTQADEQISLYPPPVRALREPGVERKRVEVS